MRARIPSKALEGLLFAVTTLGPFAFGAVEPWSRAALEILALLLALCCFLKGRRAGSRVGAYFWLSAAGVALYGCWQALTPAAADGPRPPWPFTVSPRETRISVMLWVSYAAVLWSVPRVVVTPEAARRYARAIFAAGAALALLGLMQAATGTEKIYWLREESRASFFASYYNRDHAANVLLMALAIGIGIFFSRLRGARAAQQPWQVRLASQGPLAAAWTLAAAALAVCASEAAFLAVPLAGAVTGLMSAGFARSAWGRRARAAGALAAAALVVLFAYYHVSTAAEAGALVERSVMARLWIYSDAWRWWLDAPLFGTGLGSFASLYPAYQDFGLAGSAAHAHSDWIEFGLETGAAGLLGVLCAAGVAAWRAARAWRRARSSEMRALIGGGVAAAAAFTAHALFEFPFQIPANAFMFFGVVGFLLSAPSWADKAAVEAKPQAPPVWAAAAAVAYFAVLARAAALPAVAHWRAGDPGDQTVVEGVLEAFELDEDPRLLSRLAALSCDEAEDSADAALLRRCLGLALAAAERRPFHSGALHLAGESLWRLGRPDDARVYLERARSLRFSNVKTVREGASRRMQRKLELLREIDLLPLRLEER